LSAKQKKRKGAGESGLQRGEVGGPLGRRAGRGRKVSFLFFLFQTHVKPNFLNSNSNKTFSNFSQNFIIFLKVTQATKNHAKPNNDAQPLVVSILIKLSLIF
jgi:hypothetical protein